MIEYVDKHLLNYLKFLEDNKFLEENIVVLTSDHGYHMPPLNSFGSGYQENANFMLSDLRDKERAVHLATESIKRYEEWGAARTVERLKTKYAEILQDTVPPSVGGFISLGGRSCDSGLEPSTSSLGLRSGALSH